ncbi:MULTISPECIES: YbjO family protein [Pantoea]|uniref:DUF2593 family protein n=1 Tax=Candidatus Pantoea multigeneris TaxID=2608357 RepID=A0ABX0RBZ6_9GAMM|nr:MULTISPECIES: YbjO family protein [Pantoea]NIF22866.1 DUF2593 family protein [Pantoea multigeneris]
MSETFKTPFVALAPVAVTTAAVAIITTRCLSVLMLIDALGVTELMNFVHRSAQAWDSTLIFIASQLIFLYELRCAFLLLRGRNSARWGFIAAQGVVLVYMLLASLGFVYPELFSFAGQSDAEAIHHTLVQKLPDALVIMLLFVPASSRAFFRKR